MEQGGKHSSFSAILAFVTIKCFVLFVSCLVFWCGRSLYPARAAADAYTKACPDTVARDIFSIITVFEDAFKKAVRDSLSRLPAWRDANSLRARLLGEYVPVWRETSKTDTQLPAVGRLSDFGAVKGAPFALTSRGKQGAAKMPVSQSLDKLDHTLKAVFPI